MISREDSDTEKFIYAKRTDHIYKVPTSIVIAELKKGMLYLGIKGDKLPSDLELQMMFKILVEEYKNLKIGELALAFQLASLGRLDFDAETYQNFSIIYLNRLLSAYARWGAKKVYQDKVLEAKHEPTYNHPKVSDGEKVQLAMECYRQFKQWDNIVFAIDVFHILHRQGRIIVDADYTYDKVISAMSNRMFNGSHQEKENVKSRLKDDDFMENQCYRMAVADYFDKIQKA